MICSSAFSFDGLGVAFLACGDFGKGCYRLWPDGNFEKSSVQKMGDRVGMA